MHIKDATLPMSTIDGLSYAISSQDENGFFPAKHNQLLFYAFVRDIHFTDGLQLIVPNDCALSLAGVNAVTPVSSKLFSIPQQFVMKQEIVDDILASLI